MEKFSSLTEVCGCCFSSTLYMRGQSVDSVRQYIDSIMQSKSLSWGWHICVNRSMCVIINPVGSLEEMCTENVQQATVFILAGKPSAKYILNSMCLVIESQ
jgi:hypothetical protein